MVNNYYKSHEIPKIHEVCYLIPHRSPLEEKQFIEDVKQDGAILNPVWSIIDEHGEHAIIDGRHRAEVAQMLGMDLPYEIKEVPLDQLRDFIFRNNIGYYADSGRQSKGSIVWGLCKMMLADGLEPSTTHLPKYGYRSSNQKENVGLREIDASYFLHARKSSSIPILAQLVDAGDLSVIKAYTIGNGLDWNVEYIERCLSLHWEELQSNVTLGVENFKAQNQLILKKKELAADARSKHLQQELQTTAKQKEDAEHELKIAREQLQKARTERDVLKNSTRAAAEQLAQKWYEERVTLLQQEETTRNDYTEYENTQLKDELKKEQDLIKQLQQNLSDLQDQINFTGEDPKVKELQEALDLEKARREAEADQLMAMQLELEAWENGEKTVETEKDHVDICATCPYVHGKSLDATDPFNIDVGTL